MLFFSRIPHGKVEDHAWKQTALGHAQDEARDEEPGHVLSDAQQGCDYTPAERECGKPCAWRCQFQDDVAWYLISLVELGDGILDDLTSNKT